MSDVAGTPVSAHDVAREIRRRLPGVPAVKLQKLLYFCQGHHLGTFGEPLFTEPISAWDMGPVVTRVWFRETNHAQLPQPHDLTEAQLNTIGYVISRYGANTGADLSTLTHNQKPWQRANQQRRPGQSAKIETEWIRDFFAGDVEEYEVPLDSAEVRKLLAGAAERQGERVDADIPDEWDRLVAMREELAGRA